MKKIVLLLLFISVHYCNGQKNGIESGYWMPSQFIDSLRLNGYEEEYRNLLNPFRCILINDNKVSVESSGGDFYEIETHPVTLNNNQKFEVKGNATYFNIEVFKNNPFKGKDVKFYISSYKKNKMLLEIIENGKTDSILLVNEINDFKFNSGTYDLLDRFKKTGCFNVFDSNNIIIAKNISINLNGKISNWDLYENYFVEDTGVSISDTSFYKKSFELIRLNSNSNSKSLALDYIEGEKGFILYEYNSIKEDYKVKIEFSNPIYIFKKEEIRKF